MRPLVASVTCQAHHCHALAHKNQVHCPPPPPPDSTPATLGWQTSWHIGTHCSHRDWILAVVHKLMKMKREGHERRTCRNPYTCMYVHTVQVSSGTRQCIFAPIYWFTLDWFWLCTPSPMWMDLYHWRPCYTEHVTNADCSWSGCCTTKFTL